MPVNPTWMSNKCNLYVRHTQKALTTSNQKTSETRILRGGLSKAEPGPEVGFRGGVRRREVGFEGGHLALHPPNIIPWIIVNRKDKYGRQQDKKYK